jgi:hypothetical protein
LLAECIGRGDWPLLSELDLFFNDIRDAGALLLIATVAQVRAGAHKARAR